MDDLIVEGYTLEEMDGELRRVPVMETLDAQKVILPDSVKSVVLVGDDV